MPNLIPLPSNAFSGAAVKWDNAPVDRMLLQNTWAKQQASQLALDKYFDKQANQLTGTGMDMQNDGQDFIALKDKWQQHALQNRRAIVNPSLDGGKALMESNAMYNEARQFAQKSIQKVKNSQAAYKILSDPAKAALLTDAARDKLHHGTLGLNDPEYVPLDINDVAFNPKPWGTADEAGLSNEVAKYKGTSTNRPPVQNAKTGMQTVTTDTTFDPKTDLPGMYGAGAQRYYSSPGFKAMIDQIPKNPLQFQDLNNLFKQHYGHDVQTGEDLAAAYAISKNPNARSVDKDSPIPGYSDIAQGKKLENTRAAAGVSLNKSEKLHDYDVNHPAASSTTPPPDSEGLLQGWEQNSQKNLGRLTMNGQRQYVYNVEKDPKLMKLFDIPLKNGHSVHADDVQWRPDEKKYVGVYYQKDNDGAPIKDANGDPTLSGVYPPNALSRESVKAGVNAGYLPKKEAGSALPKATPTAPSTGKKQVKWVH